MKKNLIIILLLLGFRLLSSAQETTIEPSQQAKSYLNAKNVNVDYSTGTFYYKVPLQEIKLGNFTLPVSLNYASRGVKTDDQPGAIGYNWSLNVGGVVTRTVRGGFADEIDKGAARYLEVLDWGNQSSVNSQMLDGESDIFTAAFHGRSVDFIIRYRELPSRGIVAIPLVPSNVKIECLWGDYSRAIEGWLITDEEGNKYLFNRPELCSTVREGTVETNAVKNETYASSWYLSSIVPVGTTSGIEYEYYKNVTTTMWNGDSVLLQRLYSRTTVNYAYGEPIIERAYNFGKYKDDFTRELNIAMQYLQWVNAAYYEAILSSGLYNSLNDVYLNGNGSQYELMPDKIMQNMKTMGVLYDLRYVEEAYAQIMFLLDRLIQESGYQSSSASITQAIYHLNNVKQILETCREEVIQVHHKYFYQFGNQSICSPMIKRIKGDNGVIEFKYNNNREAMRFVLDNIIVRDVNNDPVKSIRLNSDVPRRGIVSEIAFHDKFGNKISNIKFDYYELTAANIATNIYGFPIEYDYGVITESYRERQRYYYGMDKNSAYNTLKRIRISNDADIELRYMPNRCNLSLFNFGTIGGIVIEGIEVKDKISGEIDIVDYYYHGGKYVLPQLTNMLKIDYMGGFQDVLSFDRLYNPGPDAYVKLGNNGVYYAKVEEIFRDKGRIAYHFVVPETSSPVYNYWNIGDLLGECYYDAAGCLQKVIRYEYDDELASANKKFLTQVKRCEYYVDVNSLTGKYGSDPYFASNMRERLFPILPIDQSYQIAYDYDAYLKRILEYDFDDENPVSGQRLDYTRESSCYTKTEYDYDLSRSFFPVKKTVTSSDGTKRIEMMKRALDFDDGDDASISLLKEKNMVGMPLKVRSIVVGTDGIEHLMSEQVSKYERFDLSNDYVMLPSGIYEYMGDGANVGQESNFFSFDLSKYDKTAIGYEYNQKRYVPASTERLGDRTEVCHDVTTGNQFLKVIQVPENTVAACDYRRFKTMLGRPVFKLSNARSAKYRLFVLHTLSAVGTLELTIKQVGGTFFTRSFPLEVGSRGPQMFEIDLSATSNIDEISLSRTESDLVYLALVPVDASFEATSYNADGTVYCKFDQSGQAERYEYDSVGRMSKVFDQDGHFLRENIYNVVIIQ